MEGIIITADVDLKQRLPQLYRESPESKRCVIAGNVNTTLDMSCPTVHQNACTAAGESLAIVNEAGRPDLAARIP
jgi:hypothetical protein